MHVVLTLRNLDVAEVYARRRHRPQKLQDVGAEAFRAFHEHVRSDRYEPVRDMVPVRLAIRAGLDGSTRGDVAAGAVEQLDSSAVHKRQPNARIGVGEDDGLINLRGAIRSGRVAGPPAKLGTWRTERETVISRASRGLTGLRRGTAVSEAGLDDRLEIVEGVMRRIPFPDASFDLVWCRDVLTVVDGLDSGIAEIARVLRPGGHLIVYIVLATDRLEPKEAEMLLGQSLAIMPENVVEANVEDAFRDAGLEVVVKDEIGTEWREHAEERSQPASQALLRLARLRRQRDRIVAEAGEEIYAHIESNLHWLVYQFLGKLMPTIYVFAKPT